jgi:hypothetical protein
MKRIVIGGMVLIALAVVGCAKKVETTAPPGQVAPAVEYLESTGPGAGVPVEPKSGAGGSEEEWKTEWGPEDAKVKVEALYPLTEGHEWVKEYAKEIADKYPTQVKVIVFDVTTDQGGEEWGSRGLTCGVWQINGETVLQRSESVGGWKKPELLEKVKKAVDEAGGGGAEKEKGGKADAGTEKPDEEAKAADKSGEEETP